MTIIIITDGYCEIPNTTLAELREASIHLVFATLTPSLWALAGYATVIRCDGSASEDGERILRAAGTAWWSSPVDTSGVERGINEIKELLGQQKQFLGGIDKKITNLDSQLRKQNGR